MAEHTPTEHIARLGYADKRRAEFDRWLAEFNRWLTEARHEAAAGTNIADMRSDEDRATVRAIRDRAARRDNPLPKGDDMTDFNLSREAVRAACRAVHPTRWEHRAIAHPCEECTTAVTAAAPYIAAEVRGQREAFLPSDTLDPAWIAGWHAAVDHVAAHIESGVEPTTSVTMYDEGEA